MTIVNGDMWIEGERQTLFLSCTNCGAYLDNIENDEISAYLDYVLRTDDKAFCSDCDSSQDDIIHPFVDEIFRKMIQNPYAEYCAL